MPTSACSRCSPAANWALCDELQAKSIVKTWGWQVLFAPRRIMHVARDLIQSMASARVATAFPAPQLTCDDLLRLKLSLPAYSSRFLPLLPRRKQRVSFLAYTGSYSLGSGASRGPARTERRHELSTPSTPTTGFLLQCWLLLNIAAQCPGVGPTLRNWETAGIDEVD